MNAGAPLLVVPFVLDDEPGSRCLKRVTHQLRRRGLKVRVLRASDETAVGECDVLLVSCDNRKADFLAKELEHLWTLAWNRWYAHAHATKGARHAN